MKVLDLFSGCGGLSLGFEQAGFEIYGGIDNNPDAVNTFQINFPNSIAILHDLNEIDIQQILHQLPDVHDVEILIGGPPCQGFSPGNRWTHETDDERNRLFFSFVEFVELIQPKVVVIENVRQIITKNNGYAKERIYEIFETRGYTVTHKILDSSDYNIPQIRKRNFFVITKDFDFDFDTIEKGDNAPTVGEALSELYPLEISGPSDMTKVNLQLLLREAGLPVSGKKEELIERLEAAKIKIEIDTHILIQRPTTEYQSYLRASDNKITNHVTRYPMEKTQLKMSHVPQGENWKAIPEHLWPTIRHNRHSSAYRRLHEMRPSCTIDTGITHSNYFHPIFNRIPSPRESARLQSFPDKFYFTGNRTQQYIQVGNAVPPLMAKALAVAIMGALK